MPGGMRLRSFSLIVSLRRFVRQNSFWEGGKKISNVSGGYEHHTGHSSHGIHSYLTRSTLSVHTVYSLIQHNCLLPC